MRARKKSGRRPARTTHAEQIAASQQWKQRPSQIDDLAVQAPHRLDRLYISYPCVRLTTQIHHVADCSQHVLSGQLHLLSGPNGKEKSCRERGCNHPNNSFFHAQ
jgi:hypothetical protein